MTMVLIVDSLTTIQSGQTGDAIEVNKILSFSLIGAASIIVLSVASLWFFSSSILSANAPTYVKSLAQVLFPPEDLYKILATESVDLSETPIHNQLVVVHKYHGVYEVGLIFSDFSSSDYASNRALSITSEVECRSDGQIFGTIASNEGQPFLGKYGSGFSLLSYNVPEQLPLDKAVKCEVSILQLDEEAVADYGSAEFFVRRKSNI